MITPAQFNLLVSTINTSIQQVYAEPYPAISPMFCAEQPSDGSQGVYYWVGRMPKMRLWNGARVVHEPPLQSYALPNQTFEVTYGLDRFRVDDDKSGLQWQAIITEAARQTRNQPEYMFRDLLQNQGDQTGVRQLGLDGLTGFNTAHPVDIYDASLGTYSNDFRGGFTATLPDGKGGTTTVNVGGAFGVNSLFTAYSYMTTYIGQDGERLMVVPNQLLYPPLLKGEVEVVIKNSFFAPPTWGTLTGQVGAAENPFQRYGLTPILDPLLDGFDWFLADTNKSFKPFIHQRREAPRIVPRVQENDPIVFDSHLFVLGAWDRQAIGWGPSFLVAVSGP